MMIIITMNYCRQVLSSIQRVVKILFVIFFALVGNSVCMADSMQTRQTNLPEITMKNWKRHPNIVEIRHLHQEILEGIKKGGIRVEKTVYEIESSACKSSHINTISEEIGLDERGNIRYYKELSFVSMTVAGLKEYFLDEYGVARFIYSDFGDESSVIRLYFDEVGKYLFGVETIAGKEFDNRGDNSLYLSADQIRRGYKVDDNCPIDKAKSTNLGIK